MAGVRIYICSRPVSDAPTAVVAMAMRNVVSTPDTITRTVPRREEHEDDTGHGSGWIVVVYNNDVNTYEQVIQILMQATGCTGEEAYIEAWEVDHLGKSVVHHGSEEECNRVAGIIRTIGIQVEVIEE